MTNLATSVLCLICTQLLGMEFFLNVSLNSVTKIFVIKVKGLEPGISSVRDRDATTVPARHM